MMRRFVFLLLLAAACPALAQAPPPISSSPVLKSVNPWTGQNFQPPCPLTFANPLVSSAIACAAGPQYGVGLQSVTLTGNTTLNMPTGLKDGQVITYRFAQDNTGSRTIIIPTTIRIPSASLTGNLLNLTGSAASVDELTCHGFGGISPTFLSTEMDCPGFVPALTLPSSMAVSGTGFGQTSGTTLGFTMSQVKSGDRVVVASINNGTAGSVISSISGTNTTGWAQRAISFRGASNATPIILWSGAATANATNETVNITFNNATSFNSAVGISFAGVNPTTPFDPNGALPNQVNGNAVMPTITTSHASDVLLAACATTGATPTAGAGWTAPTNTGTFLLFEYQIVSAIQSGTVATINTGGPVDGCIGDALQSP